MADALSWFLLVLGICLAAMVMTVVSRQTETFADYGDGFNGLSDADNMYLPDSGEDPDMVGLSPTGDEDDAAVGMTEDTVGAEFEDEQIDDGGDDRMMEVGEGISPFVGEEFTPFA